MAAEERLHIVEKNLILLVPILSSLAIVAITIAIITFVLYGRARMKEQEAREKMFLKIHYASMFVLLLLGIVYMFFMIEE